MFALGLGAILHGMTYQMGTLSRMGPGFFPVWLGAILALMGVAIVAGAAAAEPRIEEKRGPMHWRAWILIPLSIVAFIVLGNYGGLLPATFALVFISALADRQNTLKNALVLSLAIMVVETARENCTRSVTEKVLAELGGLTSSEIQTIEAAGAISCDRAG